MKAGNIIICDKNGKAEWGFTVYGEYGVSQAFTYINKYSAVKYAGVRK